MNFLSIVWNPNPVFFSIGSYDIRWYGITWMVGFAFAMVAYNKWLKEDGWTDKTWNSLFWWSVLSAIIGARVGHCLFYNPGYYLNHPLEILNFREGGMASHGTAVGLLIGFWCWSKINKVPYLWGLDRVMLAVTLGGGFVRLGNLMNSEIYGTATDLPWGFIFVRAGETLPKHPTQIYEAICYFITFAVLAWLCYKKDAGHRWPGLLLGVGLTGIFVSRFFIEFIKNPVEVYENDMTLMMGQWLSIPFIILGIGLTLWSLLRKPVARVCAKSGTG